MARRYNKRKWIKKHESIDWWDTLSLDNKVKAKKCFDKLRIENNKRKFPYPSMYDLRNIRISKLSEKHIMRIWVFKGRIFNNEEL